MIFHDLRTIFMHVERTGGVSIRKHLLQYENNFQRLGKTKHYTSEELKDLCGKYWDQYFKFGFCRNPYERLLSWYLACKKNKRWHGNEFVDYMRQFKNFHDLVMAKPHERIIIPQWKKLEGAKFIGRFEKYEIDFMEICEQIGIPYKHIKVNSTSHKSYRDYYTVKMKRKVKNWYREDLERFNYEF